MTILISNSLDWYKYDVCNFIFNIETRERLFTMVIPLNKVPSFLQHTCFVYLGCCENVNESKPKKGKKKLNLANAH